MKTLLAVIIAGAFSTGIAVANEDDIEISDYDANQDGVLSQDEVAAHQEISARFEELDANGDGQLGEDELDEGPIDDFDEIGEDVVEEDGADDNDQDDY